MKNLENRKALDEMELAKVAGGDNDTSMFDMFLDWLTQLPVKAPSKRGKC